MRKSIKICVLALAALLLTGCAAKQAEEAAPVSAAADDHAQTQAVQGPLAERVQTLMSNYAEELRLVAAQSPENLTYTIPGDMLNQMGADAWETGAKAENGRWRFTWRQTGDFSYAASADDAAEPTPDPADETPMDSQLNGDYAVSGGGVFIRERAYDVAEDLSFGEIIISDSLNGGETGSEVFRFRVRDGQLYFADAVLNLSADMDGLTIQSGFLAAVGVLRADGLEIVEFSIPTLDDLPDPATLNMNSLLTKVTPLSHLSAQKDQVKNAKQ